MQGRTQRAEAAATLLLASRHQEGLKGVERQRARERDRRAHAHLVEHAHLHRLVEHEQHVAPVGASPGGGDVGRLVAPRGAAVELHVHREARQPPCALHAEAELGRRAARRRAALEAEVLEGEGRCEARAGRQRRQLERAAAAGGGAVGQLARREQRANTRRHGERRLGTGSEVPPGRVEDGRDHALFACDLTDELVHQQGRLSRQLKGHVDRKPVQHGDLVGEACRRHGLPCRRCRGCLHLDGVNVLRPSLGRDDRKKGERAGAQINDDLSGRRLDDGLPVGARAGHVVAHAGVAGGDVARGVAARRVVEDGRAHAYLDHTLLARMVDHGRAHAKALGRRRAGATSGDAGGWHLRDFCAFVDLFFQLRTILDPGPQILMISHLLDAIFKLQDSDSFETFMGAPRGTP